MTEYSEIILLKNFKELHKISVAINNAHKIESQLIPVEINIKGTSYLVHVEDEYDDSHINNEYLHLVIVLRAFEDIEESTDFLDWCKQLNVNASNEKLLEYYKTIISKIQNFKKLFEDGKITSFISDLDYQLNAGAIQILRFGQIK